MEAARWVRWLAAHHLTVSIGLMQVNTEIASRFSVSADQLFDPAPTASWSGNSYRSVFRSRSRHGRWLRRTRCCLSFYNTEIQSQDFGMGMSRASTRMPLAPLLHLLSARLRNPARRRSSRNAGCALNYEDHTSRTTCTQPSCVVGASRLYPRTLTL